MLNSFDFMDLDFWQSGNKFFSALYCFWLAGSTEFLWYKRNKSKTEKVVGDGRKEQSRCHKSVQNQIFL